MVIARELFFMKDLIALLMSLKLYQLILHFAKKDFWKTYVEKPWRWCLEN